MNLDNSIMNSQVEYEEDSDLLTAVENDHHTLILHNDDYNTFDHVIESLVNVCNHSEEQAHQCALITHFKGKSEVKEGAKSVLEKMGTKLNNLGLSATIS